MYMKLFHVYDLVARLNLYDIRAPCSKSCRALVSILIFLHSDNMLVEYYPGDTTYDDPNPNKV